jgi:hypothetical protein
MMKIRVFVLIALVLGWTAVAAAKTDREGIEKILRTAKVFSMEEVGEGISHPVRIKLKGPDGTVKAIYKSIDNRFEGDIKHGNETVAKYYDSYKNEIAVYEFDKLIGLDLLQVIVERRIKVTDADGKSTRKKGSVKEWADDVLPRYGHGQVPPTGEKLKNWRHTMWLFDYLIYNVDRGTPNIMIATDWSPVVIDNSMTFNTFQTPIRPL